MDKQDSHCKKDNLLFTSRRPFVLIVIKLTIINWRVYAALHGDQTPQEGDPKEPSSRGLVQPLGYLSSCCGKTILKYNSSWLCPEDPADDTQSPHEEGNPEEKVHPESPIWTGSQEMKEAEHKQREQNCNILSTQSALQIKLLC